MTTNTALVDHALAHGWDDDDLDELEQALASHTGGCLAVVVWFAILDAPQRKAFCRQRKYAC